MVILVFYLVELFHRFFLFSKGSAFLDDIGVILSKYEGVCVLNMLF